jgi:hypothetical protein
VARVRLTMLPPGWHLGSATNPAMSPLSTVAFQVASRSVLEATSLGIEFIRCTKIHIDPALSGGRLRGTKRSFRNRIAKDWCLT